MTLASATLSTELQNVVPEAAEVDAITNLVEAYAAYASDAEALSPILTAGVDLGKAAMAAALVGMSTPGAGGAKYVAGFAAFWTGVAGGLAASFAGATAITPPTFSSLLAALQPVFDDNTNNEENLVDAMDAIASVVHANVGGGTVTTVGPVVTPII